MGKMSRKQRSATRPIFIVGSPRSGTSILTWCLGQHPNILGLEESNWMTDFAVDVAARYKKGSRRGERSQLASMGMSREDLMSALGKSINRTILAHRKRFEMRRAEQTLLDGSEAHPAFKIARSESDPKSRWVNGTPEYSRNIAALRKLFPDAVFIHLLRNVDEVVRSMVHFDRLASIRLVENEEEAYRKWMLSVRACANAEQAYGQKVVCRLHHEELISDPVRTMRRVLEFVGEDFSPLCLEPLQKRINSSEVTDVTLENDPATDAAVVAEARDLWRELRQSMPPASPVAAAAEKAEQAFDERVAFVLRLEEEHRERTEWALRSNREIAEKDARILELQKELDGRNEWVKREIVRRQKELEEKISWAHRLEAECARKDAHILDLQQQFDERSAWAIRVDLESACKDSVIANLENRLQREVEIAMAKPHSPSNDLR